MPTTITRTIQFASASHPGMVRKENQDHLGKFPEDSLDLSSQQGQLFVVADGMGGHQAGSKASEMAVANIAKSYFASSNEDVLTNLRRAFSKANEQIYRCSLEHPEYRGMGTTCSALVLKGSRGYIGHVGDSRIYRIGKRKITQLTKDHSKVAEMVRQGILTKEEARYHPERSHLYRALGTRPAAEVDFIDDISLDQSRYFLLCSDGLFNHVEERELQKMVLSHPPTDACKMLIELANQRGGLDNITVQVIHLTVSAPLLRKILRK
jgi:serine/threonine protein phosphatase PrpC